MIQCFNPSCRSISTVSAGRCKVCDTPLLYRFLVAVPSGTAEFAPGTLVAGRFLVWGDGPGPGQRAGCQRGQRLWLDTRPETPTPPLEQIPPSVLAYLKLFHLSQHVPRPYAYLTPEQTGLGEDLLLLDMAPVAITSRPQGDGSSLVEATLLPSLTESWVLGSGLQQLNWLRQMAGLWMPLGEQQVAQTLLELDEVRVDGALVRLTTLVADGAAPTLADLGQRWQELATTAQPSVADYLGWLGQALENGTLTSAAALEAELEGAIQALAQGLKVTVDWAADTDQGPTRDRNEDACYPAKTTREQRLLGSAPGAEAPPLLLVCDGIGGHEQGSVASQIAIKLIQQELEPLTQAVSLDPGAIAQRLKQALTLANDAISARNNDENRSARARMGTTVVAALVHFPYLFIANIGDSRAYRISPNTCYQVTVDDDVASREAQLGYALYSEAVQLPSGGALIQALGISDSGYLSPSVQRLLLDDAAVLLLCSDGLSDYDRVDALAPHWIAPLVTNGAPLGAAVTDLIRQANRLNGHDNVTVGLMRVTPQSGALPTLPGHSLTSAASLDHPGLPTAGSTLLTQVAAAAPEPRPAGRRRWAWAAFLGGMAAVLAVLGAAAWGLGQRQTSPVALVPLVPRQPSPALAGHPLDSAALAATVEVPVGSFWQVAGAISTPLQLLPQPETPPGTTATAVVATGSILRVVSSQTTAAGETWVRLQVCSIPSGESLDQRPQEGSAVPTATAPNLNQQLSAPGSEGWLQPRQLYGAAIFLELVTPAQADRCLS